MGNIDDNNYKIMFPLKQHYLSQKYFHAKFREKNFNQDYDSMT